MNEDQNARRLVIVASKWNEFCLTLADLRLVAWRRDCCFDSPTMKHFWRRANSVGSLLDRIAPARLVPGDPCNEIGRLYPQPPSAGGIDEHNPPLVVQDANRLSKRIEQPRQVLG